MSNEIAVDESKIIGDYLGYSFKSYFTKSKAINILKAYTPIKNKPILSIEYIPAFYQQALRSLKKMIRRQLQ